MRKVLTFGLLIAAVTLSACGSAGQFFATETPTPTLTATATITPTATSTPRPTATPDYCTDRDGELYYRLSLAIFFSLQEVDMKVGTLNAERDLEQFATLAKEVRTLQSKYDTLAPPPPLQEYHDLLGELLEDYAISLEAVVEGDKITAAAYGNRVVDKDAPALVAAGTQWEQFCGWVTPEPNA